MIVIPIKPISTNRLFQGRRFKTKNYDAFIRAALYLAPKGIEITKGKVGLNIDFYIKNDKKSDLDNLLKGIIDVVVKAGWIEDDRYIYSINAWKYAVKSEKEEKIELNIISIKKET